MFRLRILTVAILLPVFAASAIFLPQSWWAVLMFAVMMLGAGEWTRLLRFGRLGSMVFYGGLAAGSACLAGIGGLDKPVFMASTIFWSVVVPLALWRKPSFRHPVTGMLAGALVLLPMWLAALRLQGEPALLLALLAVVWVSDSAAYAAGRAIGRHKLAPAISPGKTWEGVGGAYLAVAAYAFLFHFWWFPETAFGFVLPAFAALTALGILGDLFESLLKREAGVKDSGTLLPGHGGVLDRIDAIAAALPLAALMFAKS